MEENKDLVTEVTENAEQTADENSQTVRKKVQRIGKRAESWHRQREY